MVSRLEAHWRLSAPRTPLAGFTGRDYRYGLVDGAVTIETDRETNTSSGRSPRGGGRGPAFATPIAPAAMARLAPPIDEDSGWQTCVPQLVVTARLRNPAAVPFMYWPEPRRPFFPPSS
jgi:hypothetical protein